MNEDRYLELSSEELWQLLTDAQQAPYYTAKGLPFRYTIRGNEMFIDRKEKSITRSSVDMAYARAVEAGGLITGPKKLGVFGASYIYPVFCALGIIKTQ